MKTVARAAVVALLLPAATAQPQPASPDYLGPQTRAMQEDDLPTPACCGCSTARRCGRSRPVPPAGPAPTATVPRRKACAGSRRDIPPSTPTHRLPSRSTGASSAAAAIVRVRHRSPPENDDRLAILAFVAHQSRGLPIAVPDDERLRPAITRGRALFERRQGQLGLSCADCHDRHAGQRLGGSMIPPAHPTGYPVYRLEWQALGSLQRRLRNCMTGVRAEPYPYDLPNMPSSSCT